MNKGAGHSCWLKMQPNPKSVSVRITNCDIEITKISWKMYFPKLHIVFWDDHAPLESSKVLGNWCKHSGFLQLATALVFRFCSISHPGCTCKVQFHRIWSDRHRSGILRYLYHNAIHYTLIWHNCAVLHQHGIFHMLPYTSLYTNQYIAFVVPTECKRPAVVFGTIMPSPLKLQQPSLVCARNHSHAISNYFQRIRSAAFFWPNVPQAPVTVSAALPLTIKPRRVHLL